MNQMKPFPSNRDQISQLGLAAGQAIARMALLGPKGGKNYQPNLLLAGSVLAPTCVASCPRCAKRRREQLLRWGMIAFVDERLVVLKDIHCDTVSEAANIATGASKDGWDFWFFRNKPLWSLFADDAELTFYDQATPLPPFIPGQRTAVRIPSVVGVASESVELIRSFEFSITSHTLKAGTMMRLHFSREAVLQCMSGKISSRFEYRTISSPAAYVLSSGVAEFVAIEDACFTVTETKRGSPNAEHSMN